MSSKLSAATIALLAPALFLAVRPARAAWPNQAGVNLPICTAAAAQVNPVIVADGVGGAIIAWVDQRSATNDIYAQHVLASGVVDPAWPANGRALCTAANSQLNPSIVSDGAGGAIVAWQDFRTVANYDIYAQHVLASGVVDPAWPVNGRALCTAALDQLLPTIAADGAGGAIVAWHDIRGGVAYDIYAQHVLASGAVDGAWPVDGRALCMAVSSQVNPMTVADGAGGAIVTWQDFRTVANYDIYAQHVLASGAVDPVWPADGRALCLAASDQTRPTIVADGFGGGIVTWQDARTGTADIYAHHVLASGSVDIGWPSDGRALCTAGGNQQIPTIVSDGTGGAIVTWQDLRGLNVDIYAHHILATGAVDPVWPVDGRQLCAAAGDQVAPMIAPDGAAGAIVTWYDFRSAQYDVYAQHVQASGALDPLWPVDGRALCTATGNQQAAVIASDGAGGAIVAWYDARAGSPFDIYAQRVARFGYLGTPEAEITGVQDVPNDNGGKVKLSWNASYLDSNSDPNLAWYEIYRSVPPNVVAAAVARGARLLRGFAAAPSPDAETFVVEQAQYSWEYLTTQNALHYIPSYSYLAATASDSTSYQNPKTAFMIVARNSSGSIYWLSRPDTGYSVDNLPPLAPAPFAGTYSAGVASLHWRPNAEVDLANYRLYRGSSPGFVPSIGNRIATPTDTLYDDAAGNTYYYKLSAVDIHGNESGFTLLLPDGALDAPGVGARALALSRPSPNPAATSASFALTLPRESRASIAIYDPAGRHVRKIAEGVWPAGERRFEWDLRDDAGAAVRSGLYFVRARVEGRELSARLVAIQ